jgi:hypothetical protein
MSKKGLNHVMELVMEEDFGVVRTFEKAITKQVEGFSTGAVGGWRRKKGIQSLQ